MKVRHVTARLQCPAFIVCSTMRVPSTSSLVPPGTEYFTSDLLHDTLTSSKVGFSIAIAARLPVMAILASRPGIKISVICNGAALQDYDDESEEPQPNVVTKYVGAVSGAEFGVQWEITAPWLPYTILFEYWLDWKKVSGKYYKQMNYRHPAYTYLEEGASTTVNGQEFLHKFAFAALAVGK